MDKVLLVVIFVSLVATGFACLILYTMLFVAKEADRKHDILFKEYVKRMEEERKNKEVKK